MSRNATIESNRSSHDDLPTRSTTNTETFLETCVLDVDYQALKDHLLNNPVQQSDLDRCVLRALQIVQRKERELAPVAQALTILLQSGAKWNSDALLDDQKTPYHIICESPGDHHELLDLMIKSSQQTIIDTQDNRGRTALLYAVRNVNINCLKCLIANGADVNVGYCKFLQDVLPGAPAPQWTPIMEAIRKFRYPKSGSAINVDIFDVLLDNGVDVDIFTFEYYQRPIIYALSTGNDYLIKRLIEKGAHLDITHSSETYLWSIVAHFGNAELLKCMLNHGIDKDSTDLNGLSLLWWVVASRDVEAVRYLLDLGVSIPSYEQEVRERQCEQYKNYKLYIVNIKQEAQDPCIRAIRDKKLEIVKLLEEYGSQSCTSFTALRHALLYNSFDIASYLLNKYKYPLNIEYSQESDPSRSICTFFTEPRFVNRSKISKLLLDHGADPAKPRCAATSVIAIMTAIAHEYFEVIAQYIRSGVNINFRSYDCTYGNVLPFEASVLHGYYSVAEMFLISGCSCGVFSLDNNHKFRNNLKPKVEKLMKEWKVQENNVTSLKQRCRSVILNHLSPRAGVKIRKLLLPRCLINFLSIPELDDMIDAWNC